MPFVPVRWLKLRFGFSGRYVRMYASTSDEKREKVYQAWDPSPERMVCAAPVPSPLYSGLKRLLQPLTECLPQSRPGPHNTGPVPAAVFLASSSSPRLQALIDHLAATLEPDFAPDQIEAVRLAKSRPLRRDPFRLPLKIAAVAATGSALQEFQSAPWLNDQDVRNFGVRIKEADSLKQAVVDEALDILLTDEPGKASTTVRRLPPKCRPRLVIGFGTGKGAEETPSGTAWLSIPTLPGAAGSRTLVTEFLYAILHDLPLHEAVKAAERRCGADRLSARLFADPLSIEYLRLTYAFADMQRRAHQWQTSLPQLDFDSFIERLRATDPGLAEKVRSRVEAAQRKEKHLEIDPDEAAQKAVKQAAQATTALSKAIAKIIEDIPLQGRFLKSDSYRANELKGRLGSLSSYLDSAKVARNFISRADLRRLMRITPVDTDIMAGGRGAAAKRPDYSRIRNALKTAETVERIVTTPATNKRRYEEWAAQFRELPPDFTDFEQEKRGVVPLARMQAEAADLKEAEGDLNADARELLDDPEVKESLRRYQQRRADTALFRRTTDPLLGPMEKESTLAASAEYDVRFHIGNRQAESLMAGTPPPIDPLLPDPENEKGYVLEAVVQPKDFKLLSPALQPLYLPIFGGSEPVYFQVRAPQTTGRAQLRICVYYRNHLLQSFLLDAEVAEKEDRRQEVQTQFKLEFSRTSRFTNLPELGARGLSIGANRLDSTGTHQIIVKGDQSAGVLDLGDEAFTKAMKEVRGLLREATVDPQDDRKPRPYPGVSAGIRPSPEFTQFLREFAKVGNSLYRALFRASRSNRPFLGSLDRIRKSSGQTLQVVRFHERFVFPWTMLYDFDLPSANGGEVCLDPGCSHGPFDGAYCIRGFWGVRHYVEELIGGEAGDADKTVGRASRNGAVRLIVDPDLNAGTEMGQDLVKELGASAMAFGPCDDQELLQLLWEKPDERPSVLIVLGHLQTGSPACQNEPEDDRIVLVDKQKWLTERSISYMFQRSLLRWGQPRPLILLLACGSAATDVDKLNDFVLALNAAGASAIVGTECTVFSSFAKRFGEELTLAMCKADPQGRVRKLGEAMTDFRCRVLRSGNPLAFVFRAVGDADLTLAFQ